MNPPEVFSDEWAVICARTLNEGNGYRTVAAAWEARIVLTMTAVGSDGGERRVWLDLAEGSCRGARAAQAEDEGDARYVLSGTAESWRLVLNGALPPLHAIMTGKLRLAKGNLLELLPWVNAAKELVSAAAAVPASFP
ncbi:MAG: SCP2 sterol-binding domain-containing protein [Gemmatimonadales bacterium]